MLNCSEKITCCPLCQSEAVSPYFEDKKRSYSQCECCDLVFVPKAYWVSHNEEKAEYDLHENDANDQGYRQFLSRLSTPLLDRLDLSVGGDCKGLDFGCGPGPTLSLMLKEKGVAMALYDPFYCDDKTVLDEVYDFICSTEVVEHLSDPKKEFALLFSMLKSGGWLGLMTKMVKDQQAFSRWHYINDRTHICFYSRTTFEFIAERLGANVTFVGNDVILLQKH
jgi:hypothetical protein